MEIINLFKNVDCNFFLKDIAFCFLMWLLLIPLPSQGFCPRVCLDLGVEPQSNPCRSMSLAQAPFHHLSGQAQPDASSPNQPPLPGFLFSSGMPSMTVYSTLYKKLRLPHGKWGRENDESMEGIFMRSWSYSLSRGVSFLEIGRGSRTGPENAQVSMQLVVKGMEGT